MPSFHRRNEYSINLFFLNLCQLCWFYIKKEKKLYKVTEVQRETAEKETTSEAEREERKTKQSTEGRGIQQGTAYNTILAKFFAPHAIQTLISSRILVTNCEIASSLFLKTRLFLSHQISQLRSM
jgi:hypothetical protein